MLVRIPSFLTSLDKEKKQEIMKQFKSWKSWEVCELLKAHLQSELDQLILEDEKDSFSTWFQTRWSKAKRLGKREQLRQLIKDLE
ncbi:MAG: hypothetical protein OCD76_07385 [Reichenbachiella sp.]